jgi:hypothetical protein
LHNRTREELLKQLYFLTVTEWPVYEHELILRQDADRLLHDAHEKAFTRICLLADADPEASAFKRKVYDSITRHYDPLCRIPHVTSEVIQSARNLAGSTLKSLLAEKVKDATEARQDVVGHAQRRFIQELAEHDPFALDANLQVSGLPKIFQQPVKLNSDGSISVDF